MTTSTIKTVLAVLSAAIIIGCKKETEPQPQKPVNPNPPVVVPPKVEEEPPTILRSFLPNTIYKKGVTSIEFHVKDGTITDNKLSASVPVYYDISEDGKVINIYTSAPLIDISSVTDHMFYEYAALKTIDLSKTIVPHATVFRGLFRECASLESIIFGNWDTSNVTSMEIMFMGCGQLRSLDLSFMNTANVWNMKGVFSGCKTLTSVKLDSFVTSNVTDMTSMFASCQALLTLDLSKFDTGNVTSMENMFIGCISLRSLDLSRFDTGKVKYMCQMFSGCENLRQLDLSSFNTANVEDFGSMFYNCMGLENLDLSGFNTSKAQSMYFMFGWCTGLKNLNVSSFTSESLQTAELMFGTCMRLQKLDLGAFDISKANSENIGEAIMRTSKNGAIRCLQKTRTLLEKTMDTNLAGKVVWLTPSDDIDSFEYKRNPDLYYSRDFSMHETVKKLYSASEGKGIDIVLMGDAYSDRMIASGKYDEDMELAADAIFAKEPMASFKDYFNVYIVYLVSDNEFLGESTALNGVGSGSGILSGYACADVPPYYRILATGNGDLTVQEAIVVVNGTDRVSGHTVLFGMDFDVSYYDCDYGRGESKVIVGRGLQTDSEEFQVTVAHEFGHSFAKLADEYVTNDSAVEEAPAGDIVLNFTRFGWYKNVDVTSDPAAIRWSHFLSDERYVDDGVGIFEGGALYSKGVWRPSENSIMRYGTEFNAPSRAAIYNRIHKLAYGKDWQFDYEKFVEWDAKNIGLEKRPATRGENTFHPHAKQKPFVCVQENLTEDGRSEIRVIMN